MHKNGNMASLASYWIILANANLSEYVLTEVQRDGEWEEMFLSGPGQVHYMY